MSGGRLSSLPPLGFASTRRGAREKPEFGSFDQVSILKLETIYQTSINIQIDLLSGSSWPGVSTECRAGMSNYFRFLIGIIRDIDSCRSV
jgi:hypothetical protein